MKIVILSKGKERLNRSIEWLLYFISYSLVFIIVGSLFMVGYAVVLITMSVLFKSFYIDSAHPLLYSILATFILYILNKTVKPILVSLTIPITGVTLGLFYPFINLFVLKLVDWILGSHFDLKDFWVALVISIHFFTIKSY